MLEKISNKVTRFFQDSLYRNSTYLLVNLALNAGSGFLFVVICTRLYSQEDFGYAAALFGALNLVVTISNFGMNRTIIRFLSNSSTQSQDIVTKISLVTLIGLIAGSIFSIFFTSLGIKSSSLLLVILFMTAVVFGSIKSLLDNVFVALRNTKGVLIENGAYNLARLSIPFLVVSIGYIGIFSATMTGYVIGVIVSFFMLKKVMKLSGKKPSAASMKGKWRFALGSYTYEIIGGFTNSVLPIIILSRFGAIQNAEWFAVIQIVFFLLMMCGAVNDAMFAEMSNAKEGMRKFVMKASLIMSILLFPAILVVLLFADAILRLFGAEYVSGAEILKLMALFTPLAIVNYIAGSMLAYFKKVFFIVAVNAVNTIIILVYSLLIAKDIRDVAIGWIVAEFANATLLIIGAIHLYKSQRTV